MHRHLRTAAIATALLLVPGTAAGAPPVDADTTMGHNCEGAGAQGVDARVCDLDDDGREDAVGADAQAGPAEAHVEVSRAGVGEATLTEAEADLEAATEATGSAGASATASCFDFDGNDRCDFGLVSASGGTDLAEPVGLNQVGVLAACGGQPEDEDCAGFGAVVVGVSTVAGDQSALAGQQDGETVTVCASGDLVDEGCNGEAIPELP